MACCSLNETLRRRLSPPVRAEKSGCPEASGATATRSSSPTWRAQHALGSNRRAAEQLPTAPAL